MELGASDGGELPVGMESCCLGVDGYGGGRHSGLGDHIAEELGCNLVYFPEI